MSKLLMLLNLFFPLLPILVLGLVKFPSEKVKGFSFLAMLFHFLLSLPLYFLYDGNLGTLQGEYSFPLITSWGAHFHLGLDGINLFLILLTTLLGPLVALGSFEAIKKQERLFYSMLFLLQFFMLGTFMSQNLFVFYLFWEAMLIPMFFIIGIWGGENRIYATIKFFLYTAFGSILMLVAMIWLLQSFVFSGATPSLEFSDLYKIPIPFKAQLWLFGAFFISFAIKVPLFPFHTWLPSAHVEAPTPGSVILAAVLLKMGTYGIIKLAFPLFPQAAYFLSPTIAILAVISIVYGALLAFSQGDIKKIIACSSISHLGYVVLGLVSFNLLGIQGAMIQMLSHGFTAGGLFLIVGMIYERTHTRELSAFGGLAKIMPHYAILSFILILASIGFPGTSGFTGEFLSLMGYFQSALEDWKNTKDLLPLLFSLLALTGVILGALYMLRFAQGVFFGPCKEALSTLKDINLREKALLITISFFIFLFGLYPKPFLDKMEKSLVIYKELSLRK